MLENLQSSLQKNNATFELITHEKLIYSSQNGVNYFGINIAQTAPIIIIKTEKSFFAVIASGERGRINLESVARIFAMVSLSSSVKFFLPVSQLQSSVSQLTITPAIINIIIKVIIDSFLLLLSKKNPFQLG